MLCASCSTVMVYTKHITSLENVIFTELTLTNEGEDDYDIPLEDNVPSKKYMPIRRINVPDGYDAFVLIFGMRNLSDTNISVELKSFSLKCCGNYFEPVATNTLKNNSWIIGLGQKDSKEYSDSRVVYLVYLIPKGCTPEIIVMGKYAIQEIPIRK